ncbi:MAG: winged helix-turn-helix domain-containing protein [Tissierellia bacterium]|nr:winged helix-turn-helix domain-containing protein [Tissierellia bacterium]
MKDTLINRVFEFISENPKATNEEIAAALNTSSKVVSTYIRRLENKSRIFLIESKDGREIKTLEIPKDFKRSAYEMMVEKYLEDFESAEFYTERIEIGKLILRLLERL